MDDFCVSVGSDVEWIWLCGFVNLDFFNVDFRNDDYVDEFLWSFVKDKSLSVGGCYILVVVERKFGEDVKERIVVGKYRYVWMIGVDLLVFDFEDGIVLCIVEVVVIYFRNGG